MEFDSSKIHREYKPKHLDLLSEEDKALYSQLHSTLSSHICRNRRGKRLETFAEMLTMIQGFCLRGDSNDWCRCLVCGVFWLKNGIAVNTRQLGLLIDKCKSSINGSLQRMGYNTLPNRADSSDILIDAIPQIKTNAAEAREWTVRLFCAATPQPSLLNYHVTTSFPFCSPAPINRTCYSVPLINQTQIRPPLPAPIINNSDKKSFPVPEITLDNNEDESQKKNDMFNTEDPPFFEDPFCLTPSFLVNNDDTNNDQDFFGSFDM